MNNMKNALLLLFLTATISSCNHVYYAPNTPNLPQLGEKGDGRISATYSTGGESGFNGGELQFAYAPHRYIGFMGSFMSVAKREETSNGVVESGTGSYGELGIGLFKTRSSAKHFSMEVFAGRGFGSVKNEYEGTDYSKVGIGKWFLQPDIGYRGEVLDVAFTPKISLIHWKVRESRFNPNSSPYEQYDVDAIRSKKNFIAFEPGIVFRAGGKQVRGHLGIGFSFTNLDGPGATLLTESMTTSFGLSIQLKKPK